MLKVWAVLVSRRNDDTLLAGSYFSIINSTCWPLSTEDFAGREDLKNAIF